MKSSITAPEKPWMKRDLYLFASSSGKVIALRFTPMRRVRDPKNTKAMKTPAAIFMKASHNSPIPRVPAAPPTPTTAGVLMNAAPQESQDGRMDVPSRHHVISTSRTFVGKPAAPEHNHKRTTTPRRGALTAIIRPPLLHPISAGHTRPIQLHRQCRGCMHSIID
jgi:hypothetical protein